MNAATPTLLLTRPIAQSRRFADAFRERFGPAIPIMIAPLMQVEEIAPSRPVPVSKTLIFSSETAVAASRRLGLAPGLPAWCVGPRTAQAANDAGFRAIQGPGDGAALAQAIIAAGVDVPCLFLRGEEVVGDIVATLKSAGIETYSVVLYRQSPLPLSPEARARLAGGQSILLPLFSPRSARLAVQEAAGASAPLLVASLSTAVDVVARALPATRRAVAAQPTGPAMLDALETLLVDPPLLTDPP